MHNFTSTLNKNNVRQYDRRWFTSLNHPTPAEEMRPLFAIIQSQVKARESSDEKYVINVLNKLKDDELQSLLPQVIQIYSDDMTNREERPKIINALLSIDSNQRDLFIKQLLLLFADCTNAHDRAWITEMLSTIKNTEERAKLAENVRCLYTENTESNDRSHLVNAFIYKTLAEQNDIVQRFKTAKNREEANNIIASLKDFSLQKLSEPERSSTLFRLRPQ